MHDGQASRAPLLESCRTALLTPPVNEIATPAASMILIVDDDPDFVYLLGAALMRRGALVDSTSSAFGLVRRAAGLTEDRCPDVIVDCDLPALAGTSALMLLAKNTKAALVPVVLVSAAPPVDAETALKGHPKARFVPKDGHFNELADLVLAQVREKQQ